MFYLTLCASAVDQDRHGASQPSRQPAARVRGRDSAFGGGVGRAAVSRAVNGGQAAFGLRQRMQVPAAMDISGLIAAPAPRAASVPEPTGVGLRPLAGGVRML